MAAAKHPSDMTPAELEAYVAAGGYVVPPGRTPPPVPGKSTPNMTPEERRAQDAWEAQFKKEDPKGHREYLRTLYIPGARVVKDASGKGAIVSKILPTVATILGTGIGGPLAGAAAGAGAQALVDAQAPADAASGVAPGGGVVAPPSGDKYFADVKDTVAANIAAGRDLAERSARYETETRVREPTAITPPTITARDTAGLTPGAISVTGAPVSEVGTTFIGEAQRTGPTVVRTAEDRTGAAQMLAAAARGEAPSAAEATLRLGLDRAAASQRALAASAKGSERRGAKRAALLAIGEQGANIGQAAAAVRAEEMATARNQFAAYSQAATQLQQQALGLQAQIDAAAARGDADAANRLKLEQANLHAKRDEINAAATNVAALDLKRRHDAARESAASRLATAVEGSAGRDLTAQTTSASLSTAAQTSTEQMRQARDAAEIAREQADQQLRTGGTATGLNIAAGGAGQQISVGQTLLSTASGDKALADARADAADRERQRREDIKRDTTAQTLLKVGTTAVEEIEKRRRAKAPTPAGATA